MRRLNSVEPVIGHLKSGGKFRQCFLNGGWAVSSMCCCAAVLLCACGQSLRKLMLWIYFTPAKYCQWLRHILNHVLKSFYNDPEYMAFAA